MKRIVSLTLAILLIAALFVGCDSTPSAEGFYVIKTLNGMDVETALARSMGKSSLSGRELSEALRIVGADSLEEAFTLELKSDHTCVYKGIDKNGLSQTLFGRWSQSGSTIEFNNGKGTFQNGELTIKLDGRELVMIRKQN
jgi:hypothetical protein